MTDEDSIGPISGKTDQRFRESLLWDTQSLMRQLELDVTDRIPNLRTGILEHWTFLDFADVPEPPVTCPACGDDPRERCDSQYSDSSYVVKSVNQCVYLCSQCHRQSEIHSFGIYSKEDGA
jgi:hypothetical protein